MDIVIARYNEDLTWTEQLKGHNLFVYNKGEQSSEYKYNLKNYGKDAESHLYHIVNNYDNLGKYTAFLQGNPFDHWASTVKDIKNFDYKASFKPLGPVYIRDNWEYELQCREYSERMEMEYTEPFYFIGGMQIILSKSQIHKRPKYFYLKLKEDIPKTISKGSGVTGNSHQIWHLEYTWPTIFNVNKQIVKYRQ